MPLRPAIDQPGRGRLRLRLRKGAAGTKLKKVWQLRLDKVHLELVQIETQRRRESGQTPAR
jgi:hypothetical protein